ncbi:DUF4160 domain-containing protein [Francisella sp. 19X1-34]|uniref:DUF4160 domain-containing protein n=1 Tax=Francisella sp. 19X1-34 TaxID=3087177 RepID=UPI002E2EAA64|nr:DUF4160 domain-containing protein [Francisella sp. 19X1-34]MED7789270.1 DUF4160 domain-containing protein [Francisella sp. 19X1-34]
MHWDEHNPPHFHVRYQGIEATIEIKSLVIKGNLPAKHKKLIRQYALENKDKLLDNWDLLQQGKQPNKI